MTTHDSAGLLDRARLLTARSDYPGVDRLLTSCDRDELLTNPELGYHAAYAWRRVGRSHAALELVEQLDSPVRRSAESWLVRRRSNLEALLRFDSGQLDRAEQIWWAVADLSNRDGDFVLLAAAHNNIGVIQTLRDRMDEAVATYGRALLASRGLGDRRGIAQAHQNIAILHRECAHPSDADAHFRDAIQHARLSGSEDVLGRAEEERALLLLGQGDAALARAAAERALARLRSIADASGEGEALRVLGIIALHEGAMAQAAECLGSALDRAREIHNRLLEAETEEALGALARANGNAAEADLHRGSAEAHFAAMSAESWGRRVRSSTMSLAGLT